MIAFIISWCDGGLTCYEVRLLGAGRAIVPNQVNMDNSLPGYNHIAFRLLMNGYL